MNRLTLKILPCPFCGHADAETDEIDKGIWAVCCPECMTIGPHQDGAQSPEEAIEKWNKAPRVHSVPVVIGIDPSAETCCDAARYRWLRDQVHSEMSLWDVIAPMEFNAGDLDVGIDAAIAAEKGATA